MIPESAVTPVGGRQISAEVSWQLPHDPLAVPFVTITSHLVSSRSWKYFPAWQRGVLVRRDRDQSHVHGRLAAEAVQPGLQIVCKGHCVSMGSTGGKRGRVDKHRPTNPIFGDNGCPLLVHEDDKRDRSWKPGDIIPVEMGLHVIRQSGK